MYTLSTLFPFIDFQTGVLGFLVAFLIYFGLSLGLFIMALSMRLKSAWMAWFPILRMYLVGKAIDFIQAKSGKKSNHGVGLLLVRIFQQLSVWLPPVLSILLILAILLPLVGGGVLAFFYTTGDFGLLPVDAETLAEATQLTIAFGSVSINISTWLGLVVGILLAVIFVVTPVVLFCLLIVISIAAPYLAIAFTIYYYTGLYYCFAAMCKRRAPLCTILSVFFDFGASLFLPIACIGGLDKEWKNTPAKAEKTAEADTEVTTPAEVEAPAAVEVPDAVATELEISIADQFNV